MPNTAFYAPAHRVINKAGAGFAPDLAVSMDFAGNGLLDPRLAYNSANSATGAQVIGWVPSSNPKVCSQAPSAIATANIAALQNVTTGTAMTLVSSTGAGITVVGAGGFTPWPNHTNLIPSGALAIDGTPGFIQVGTGKITGVYDPTKGICRCISITGVTGGSGGDFLVSGADWYGYPMTQTVTVGAGINTVDSTKAFKFITSVVPQFTDAHNYSVGTADVFGFNIAADHFADVEIYWADVLQLVATFTAAVTTSPATATTGDVRGTFTAGSASDGTKRLDIYVKPSAARLTNATPAVGLFGVTQA